MTKKNNLKGMKLVIPHFVEWEWRSVAWGEDHQDSVNGNETLYLLYVMHPA